MVVFRTCMQRDRSWMKQFDALWRKMDPRMIDKVITQFRSTSWLIRADVLKQGRRRDKEALVWTPSWWSLTDCAAELRALSLRPLNDEGIEHVIVLTPLNCVEAVGCLPIWLFYMYSYYYYLYVLFGFFLGGMCIYFPKVVFFGNVFLMHSLLVVGLCMMSVGYRFPFIFRWVYSPWSVLPRVFVECGIMRYETWF